MTRMPCIPISINFSLRYFSKQVKDLKKSLSIKEVLDNDLTAALLIGSRSQPG